jgi:prepilin-type N-terminal cleavage/methylation domain-containing protein
LVKYKTKSHSGWTLIELVIVVAIISVVTLICVPMFSTIKQNNQRQIIEHDLTQGIHAAKVYALTSKMKVWLTHLPGEESWSSGMVLMAQDGAKSKPIHTWHWSAEDFTVLWHGFQSRELLLFTQDLQHSALNGYFLIKNQLVTTKLIINRLGRVRVEHYATKS